MNGSLQKKGLMYYVVYRDSKGKQRWVNTKCKEKNKAKSIMRDILYELDHGTFIEPRKEMFIDFLIDYYNEIVQPDVEMTTFDGYMNILNNHIVPYFKDRRYKTQDIKTIDLQEYFNEKYKQGLKTSTLNRHLSIFKRFFSYVEDMDLIFKNPTRKIKLRKNEKTEQGCYSIEELNRLFEVLGSDVISPAVVLASRYAMRRGELLGLRWQDIDFDRQTLNIVNTRTKVLRAVEKGPKSKKSKKEFYLFSDIAEYLLLLKQRQEEDAEFFGDCYNQNDYVVRYPDGRPISIAALNSRFKNILERNELRHIRLHDLRHTVATLMLEGGFYIKVVQDWMRHSSTKTLMGIYAHISPDKSNSMNSEIEQYFVSNIDSSRVRKVLENQGKQEEN
ncbi:MAG: tyrosine-type recombinase/integrase [Lutisporaceae bacterium]|jgi:integrase